MRRSIGHCRERSNEANSKNNHRLIRCARNDQTEFVKRSRGMIFNFHVINVMFLDEEGKETLSTISTIGKSDSW